MLKSLSFATLATIAFAATAFAAEPAPSAKNGMFVDAKGMTLYIFDNDAGGKPSCYDDCAKKWPPYLGKAEDKMTEGWTLVERKDKTLQWAYDKKPVYFFVSDKKKGDMTGEGMGGVWHTIME